MTNQRYAELRRQLGTQEAVAAALRQTRSTIARREAGDLPITPAAELALCTLHLLQVNPNHKTMTTNVIAQPSSRHPAPVIRPAPEPTPEPEPTYEPAAQPDEPAAEPSAPTKPTRKRTHKTSK